MSGARPKILALQVLVAVTLFGFWHIGSTMPLSKLGFLPQSWFEEALDKTLDRKSVV